MMHLVPYLPSLLIAQCTSHDRRTRKTPEFTLVPTVGQNQVHVYDVRATFSTKLRLFGVDFCTKMADRSTFEGDRIPHLDVNRETTMLLTPKNFPDETKEARRFSQSQNRRNQTTY